MLMHDEVASFYFFIFIFFFFFYFCFPVESERQASPHT